MPTLHDHLSALYPQHETNELARRVRLAMSLTPEPSDDRSLAQTPRPSWSEDDIVLITYADTLRASDEAPLTTLRGFLDSTNGEVDLADIATIVHVLPFFPSSSDGGFAVVDFETVDPTFGDWSDIEALATNGRRVMADLVLNHVSASSLWFKQFLADETPGRDYFVTAEPTDDLGDVVRPRTHPLLREVETAGGARHVWATFSHDQIDVDFANPDVLIEFVKFIDLFVSRGVSVLRLDAIGYLWKRLGTPCIHLEETHRVVKVLRMLLEERAPDALLITETNVPHGENVSYFGGSGRGETEAHLVYNFTLAPLVLHALLTGSSTTLAEWAADLEPLGPATSFFNFLASHDGIGVRPVEGLLSEAEVDSLAAAVQRHGGRVSNYATVDGQRPYELNTSLFSALTTTIDGSDAHLQVERFCAAHAIMLSFVGVPAFYIHSLLATPNDLEAVAATDHNRDINRSNLEMATVAELLADATSPARSVLGRLAALARVRRGLPAFHPEADQQVLDFGPDVFAARRTPVVGDVVEVLVNVTGARVTVSIEGEWRNLIDTRTTGETGEAAAGAGPIELEPYGVAWLCRPAPKDAVRS